MPVIETAGLTKDYRRVRALNDLTLAIPEGAVGLLGPNGAGKSTLIKILLGFVQPSSGSVRVLGLDPHRAPLSARRQVGYMPEVESFIPGINAVDYVYLAARLTGLPHADAMQRTHMVLNYVSLQEERYRHIETLSTGTKQKIKFAQALVHHPKVLLLDEPTTGLDPRAREEMLNLIRDVAHGKGIEVILSTHILHDVEAVCDHAVILHEGRLIAQDLLQRLLASGPQAYDVQIKGDRGAFLDRLRARNLDFSELEEGSVRVTKTDGTEPILRAAMEAGVQMRRLCRTRDRLEDLFTRLISEQ